MNKRITSLLLCFVMVFAMLATAAPAMAAPTQSTFTFSVEADKTTAHPGDTINFTIYMQQTGTMTCLEGALVIPDGLTFVTGSGRLEDGIKDTLGRDALEWTPDPNMILNGYGSKDFAGTEKIALMKFQCTVNSDATVKNYEVKLINLVADGGEDESGKTKNPTCIPATITVTAAPKPATGITLNKTTLELFVGNTDTLAATVAPDTATDKTVTWTSSDKNVVTVNNGEIKAVGKGKATITAKTVNGKTATCEVTVYDEIYSDPTAMVGLTYTGSELNGVAPGSGSMSGDDATTLYTLSGTFKATDAGEYTATATLKPYCKWNDGTTAAKTIKWSIGKATVNPIVEITGTYKYTGKAIIPTVVVKDGTKVIPASEYNVNVTDNINAGDGAKVTVTNKDGGNYIINTKETYFEIEKGTQNAPSGLNGVAPSIDTASDGKITGVTDKMEYRKAGETAWKACTGTEITGLAAGTYEVRFKENANQTASAATQVVISAGATSVSVPTAISGLIYNGSEQIGVAEGTGYTLSGHKATNAGSYTATAALKSGYKWADGTTAAKTITWKIDKKTVTPTVEVTGTYKYTGKAIIPTVVVKDGTKVIPATEYTVNVTDNTNAGTAKVTVTNKDGGNYVIETKEATFTIGKGTQNKPAGLNGVAPTVPGESTGKITGVSDKMEYRKVGETTWKDCTGTEITGLAAGDYEIRMKATANADASAITTVTVRAKRNTNSDSADRAYEEATKNEGKKNTPTGGELVIISTVAVSIILLSSLIVFLAIVASKKKKSVR